MFTSSLYRLLLPIQHLIQFHILSIAFFINDEKCVGIFATVAVYKFYPKTQKMLHYSLKSLININII